MSKSEITHASSAPIATPNHLDNAEIIIGCCYGAVIIPARQLSDFYRGYAWMAGAGMLFAIPFSLALWALDVVLQ